MIGRPLTKSNIMASGSSSASDNVKSILSDSQFQTELTLAGDRLVVVDFYADWCKPCKVIAPKVVELAKKYPTVLFIKLNTDICSNTARRYEVSSMPTFIFFRKKEKLHTVRGANIGGLEAGIIQNLSEADIEPPVTSSSKVSVKGQVSLLGLIDKNGSECLNDSSDHPFIHAIESTTSEKYLESDCDEQLIIMIEFQQPIKLHSLQLVGPKDGRAPRTVKLFINQPQTLDFDAAEQRKPIQEFTLSEDDIGEESLIKLQYVKYQSVQNLTIFVKDNQGDEETTVIHHIGLFGSPLNATNMAEFKRVSGEKGEKHS